MYKRKATKSKLTLNFNNLTMTNDKVNDDMKKALEVAKHEIEEELKQLRLIREMVLTFRESQEPDSSVIYHIEFTPSIIAMIDTFDIANTDATIKELESKRKAIMNNMNVFFSTKEKGSGDRDSGSNADGSGSVLL